MSKPVLAALLCGLTASAFASPLLYVIGNNDKGIGRLGTVDVSTGVFQQIGPNAPVGTEGLALGPNGSLFTVAFNGDLYSISPSSGVYTRVGPTGFGDCSTADSCASNSNLTVGGANGLVYATDFQNRLYTINTTTGAATLIGPTGIPALPFIPDTLNANGTINFYEETLFGTGGKLFATFDAVEFDLTAGTPSRVVVPPVVYQINPSTGVATALAPTDVAIGAIASVGGTFYGFNLLNSEIFTLDVNTGLTTVVAPTDPAAGIVRGATAVVPEPGTVVLAGIGALVFVLRRHLRHGNG